MAIVLATLATLMLCSICQAQTELPALANSFMNITFSDMKAANCGQSSTAENESVTITIRTLSREPVYMDLDYIFTHPNVTFAPGIYSVNDTTANTTSNGNHYTLSSPAGTNAIGWSPSTYNYSQVFYSQKRANPDNDEDDSLTGNIMVRAFSDEGCPGNGLNMSTIPPWYSWNCADEQGECSTLPFGVKSILLSGLSNDQLPGRKGCVSAVKYNAGTKTRLGFKTSVVIALCGFVAMLF